MKDVDPTTFTVELGKLYELSKVSGNVSVTMKRMNAKRLKMAYKTNKTMPKGGDLVVNGKSDEYPTLIRATYKDTKISTIVSPIEFNKFQSTYATVIRAYMDTLKKKERTKKIKKQKTQQ
ncbi:signal recognition particle, SRP9/SRP14 subunit [Absidia repens]|uniref:Signal recognition particle subunit SRP14 n=1 Tax=Absidia repens TaxID=90262 RepID=A0A1X2III4_9FUNG|nr:signal recognition particle, SRP9/SRP14 subunit [Absidia repens]